ncbi:uncharacterized protein E5676_scaffold1610G00080 [Cucumis melo var. makuwa]|uniref:DUF8039 domain-containing protein n=1 Tax=Cucumis melo var. makuwa TaxID=1194695 RepID=A0A5D3CTK4_CUCMM|nr:uncharacterized protein E5676_scaffold1610G00080 [Cucumis melo var. makuwa]
MLPVQLISLKSSVQKVVFNGPLEGEAEEFVVDVLILFWVKRAVYDVSGDNVSSDGVETAPSVSVTHIFEIDLDEHVDVPLARLLRKGLLSNIEPSRTAASITSVHSHESSSSNEFFFQHLNLGGNFDDPANQNPADVDAYVEPTNTCAPDNVEPKLEIQQSPGESSQKENNFQQNRQNITTKAGRKKIPQNISSVPIDGISFYFEESVQRCKYAIQGQIANEARYNVDEWKKKFLFQKMGGLWRASKSRLVSKIGEASNDEELNKIKPDNISSMHDWNDFIKHKTSATFKAKSKKFKDMKQKQLPHTCSRKGYARLAEDLKNSSSTPITRVDVWTKTHVKKDGTPMNSQVADTLERIEQNRVPSSSSIIDDAISRVLGLDQGYVRELGFGVTLSKSVTTNTPHKCLLLDWIGLGEVIAEGRWFSNDPSVLVHHVPLGPNAVRVWVDTVKISNSFLWRPTSDIIVIDDALGTTVAWPID